jgi:DNA repair exonuclease SbcCD ATPase subunit
MAINPVGAARTSSTEGPRALTEHEGAQAIAALFSPPKREQKPAPTRAKKDPAPNPADVEPEEGAPADDAASDDDGAFVVEDDDTEATPVRGDPENVDDDDDAAALAAADDDDTANDDGEIEQAPPDTKFKHPKTGEVLTLEELYNGYLRTADYTRKTQEAAKQRKEVQTALEPELKSVREERAQIATALKELETALKESTPQEPDWDEVRQTHPEEFSNYYAQWQLHKDNLEKVAKQRAAAEEKVQQDRITEIKGQLAQEGERLLEAMPGWKDDPAKAEAGRKAVWEYGKSLGYEDDNLVSITDHRLFVVLDKARRWDAAQKKAKAAKAPEGKRPAKPGTANAAVPRKANELTRAKQRLAKTGSIHDAAAGISQILQSERKPRR